MRAFSLLLLTLLLLAPAAAQPTVEVSPAGPVRTLAEALRRVDRGGRVVVRPGVYREPTVVLDRPVTLVGTGAAVLDGEGARGLVVVTADSVALRGLTFRNVGVSYVEDFAGIRVEGGRHCVIEGNIFENTFFGVYLAKAAHCRVADNVFAGAGDRQTDSGNGIHLWYARHVTITGNTVRGHRDGIYLEFVEDADVRDNHSEGNRRYGLHFMFSDRCRYTGNTLRDNAAGVAVMYARDVEMAGNRFERNWGSAAYGLLLKDITDSRVAGNVFLGNTVGLYAEAVNRTEVVGNTFEANGWAVRVMANTEGNRFLRNDFVGNTFDVATNSRKTDTIFRENYWDQYRGHDLDRDGYGDVPFRPVRLFSLLVERNAPSLVLLRSFFVDVLDAAERVFPVLTPKALLDERPRMRRNHATTTGSQP